MACIYIRYEILSLKINEEFSANETLYGHINLNNINITYRNQLAVIFMEKQLEFFGLYNFTFRK
jgi:hypothetical protein